MVFNNLNVIDGNKSKQQSLSNVPSALPLSVF